MEVVFGERKMKNLNKWLGRTAYQLMPDRFFNVGGLPGVIGKNPNGRILKDWNDRMPNWQPNEKGEYTNDYYYGGNLKGIIAKLDYLKELGFDMIYITPIELSESYHHYNPSEQEKIDSWLGTWDDLKELCNEAHKRDMLIMCDMVFNHTGESPYKYDPKKKQWYKRNADGSYSLWWGFPGMYEVNLDDKTYQQAMKKVLLKYLSCGVDGFRFDLGENYTKSFLLVMQEIKDEYPEAIIVLEMWGSAYDKGLENGKIFDGQADSIMNYPLSDAILRWTRWGAYTHFSYWFENVYKHYPKEVQDVLLNNIATHDTPNTLTMLVGDKMNSSVFNGAIWDIESPWRHENSFDTYAFRKFEADNDTLSREKYELGKKLTRIATAIMYTIPGIPCVYQGTEISEMGYKDPFNRKPYDWSRQNEQEMKDFFKGIGTFRRNNKDILAEGYTRLLSIDENVLMLERYIEDKSLILAVNRKSEQKEIHIPDDYKEIYGIYDSNKHRLNPYGIVIARKN